MIIFQTFVFVYNKKDASGNDSELNKNDQKLCEEEEEEVIIYH